MFITKLILAVVMVGCMVGSAMSMNSDGEYMAFGYGGHSCGKFLEAFRDRDSVYAASDRAHYKSWIGGYVTAMNHTTTGTKNILIGTDIDGATAWVENWCRVNPMESFSVGAYYLYLERLDNVRAKSKPTSKLR